MRRVVVLCAALLLVGLLLYAILGTSREPEPAGTAGEAPATRGDRPEMLESDGAPASTAPRRTGAAAGTQSGELASPGAGSPAPLPEAGAAQGGGSIEGRAAVPPRLREAIGRMALHVVRIGRGADAGTTESAVLPLALARDGRYRLGALRPGTYRVQFVLDGEAVSEPRRVAVGRGESHTGVDFDFQRTPSVRGHVLDARSGGPVGSARVIAGSAPPVESQTDGSFTLFDLEAGRHTLVIEDLGHAPAQVQVTVPSRGSVEPLEVRLDAGVEVHVLARSPDGDPVAGVHITVSNAVHLVAGTTSADGLALFRGLMPGAAYDVRRPDAALDDRPVVLVPDPGGTRVVRLRVR